MRPSSPADASVRPSGLYVTAVSSLVPAVSVASGVVPACACQMTSAPSLPTAAIVFPSRL